MKIKLNIKLNENERKYIKSYLGYIDPLNKLTITSKIFLNFLDIASTKNVDYLDNSEIKKLVNDVINDIKKNSDCFIEIILPSISVLYKIIISPVLVEESVDEIITFVINTIIKTEKKSESFIKNKYDLNNLSFLDPKYRDQLVKALVNMKELNRLLQTNEDLCEICETFPDLTKFFIKAVLSDKSLRNKLISLKADLKEIQNFFPEKEKKSLLIIYEQIISQENLQYSSLQQTSELSQPSLINCS